MFSFEDEMRQAQKEEGTQELQRLQSLVKPGALPNHCVEHMHKNLSVTPTQW